MSTKKLLLTGVSGFVGKAVYKHLSTKNDYEFIISMRSSHLNHFSRATLLPVKSIDAETDWLSGLNGVCVVIHAAARVHVMKDVVSDPLAEFNKVNVAGTLNLARQAAANGVRRFIFISSIKVNGEATQTSCPFTEDAEPAPIDPYGISKMLAEQGLMEIAKETGMDVVIIRPVLVYGPGVKANFKSMMHWLTKGVPLPLGFIGNKRSLVALDNLVDLIATCIEHPAAANQIFLVSDGEDLSTTELLQRMAKALNVPARLIPVPSFLLKISANLMGKKQIAQRLCSSLQVDISKSRELLGWRPPVSVDEALKKTAKHFQDNL